MGIVCGARAGGSRGVEGLGCMSLSEAIEVWSLVTATRCGFGRKWPLIGKSASILGPGLDSCLSVRPSPWHRSEL